jgi:ketosteroid isomerase-like protein
MTEQTSASKIVDQAFTALAASDIEAARALFADDLAYHLLNFEPRHQRLYHGREAFLDLRQQIAGVSNGTYTFVVHGLYPAGSELVIVHAETTATFDGRTGGGHWVIVARVIGGLIVQITDTAETALDHFWRPPPAPPPSV